MALNEHHVCLLFVFPNKMPVYDLKESCGKILLVLKAGLGKVNSLRAKERQQRFLNIHVSVIYPHSRAG